MENPCAARAEADEETRFSIKMFEKRVSFIPVPDALSGLPANREALAR